MPSVRSPRRRPTSFASVALAAGADPCRGGLGSAAPSHRRRRSGEKLTGATTPSENRSLRRCARPAVPCPPAPPRPRLGQGGRFITATLFFSPAIVTLTRSDLPPALGSSAVPPTSPRPRGFRHRASAAAGRHWEHGEASRWVFWLPGVPPRRKLGVLREPWPPGGSRRGVPRPPRPTSPFPQSSASALPAPSPAAPLPAFSASARRDLRQSGARRGAPCRAGLRTGAAGAGRGVLAVAPPRPSTVVPPYSSRLRRRLREPVPVSSATHGLLISAGPR